MQEQQGKIEAKLKEIGLVLPKPLAMPQAVRLPFAQVRIHGNRAYISGHGPQAPDGSLAQPIGKVGAEVSLEEGYQAARLVALSILERRSSNGTPRASEASYAQGNRVRRI